MPTPPTSPGWTRRVVQASAATTVLLGLSVAAQIVSPFWGYLFAWTWLGTTLFLLVLAAASLKRRAATPAPARTWTSVWVPLATAVLNVAVLPVAGAVASLLRAVR